jgi:nitrite reductase (NADH) small subunit
MNMMSQTWIELCPIDAVPLRGSRVVRSRFGCIAVFRAADGGVFALDDRCPHSGGPLSQGIVHGRSVTCPLHNWVISLETGEAAGADQGRVRTIPIKVEGGKVWIDLAVAAASPGTAVPMTGPCAGAG